MRIALFSWESLHSIAVGGLAVHVTELAAAFARKGHEVHVFTRNNNQEMYSVIDGVHYHRVNFPFDRNFVYEMTVNMKNSMVQAFKDAEAVFGKFDIVHGHDWHVVTTLDEIKKMGRKIVLTLHTTQYGRDGGTFNPYAKDLYNIEWYGTYIADKVIAISQTFKEEIIRLYNVPEWKMRVIPNGIWAKNFDGEIDPYHDVKKHFGFGVYDPLFVFVGRMVYQKGVDMLIEAIPLVLRKYPNARFVLIGDGYMKAELETKVRAMNLNSNVIFTGYVSNEWKTKIMKAADAIIVPSRNEPFGIVVLEAWSCRKPVIATCNTGAGELIWHKYNGIKVYPTPESIAWGIEEIIKNPEEARLMGERGREIAERIFNWDRVAEETLKVYKEII